MSVVVVVGGNDRMATRYKDIIPVVRIHNASVNALKTVLEQYS